MYTHYSKSFNITYSNLTTISGYVRSQVSRSNWEKSLQLRAASKCCALVQWQKPSEFKSKANQTEPEPEPETEP